MEFVPNGEQFLTINRKRIRFAQGRRVLKNGVGILWFLVILLIRNKSIEICFLKFVINLIFLLPLEVVICGKLP